MVNQERKEYFNRAVEQHMEIEFGFKGRDYYLSFLSTEDDSVCVEEILGKGKMNSLIGKYKSVEELMSCCIIADVPFQQVILECDYFFA